MIDINTYLEVKLEDVADFERAKKGKVYPAGSSYIQISATRGQIGFLYEPGTIKSKDVVIIPQAGIDRYYFNIILQRNIDEFINKYSTGINIQEKEIANFPIQLHGYVEQVAIAKIVRQMDNRYKEKESEVENIKQLKKGLLSKMFV